MHISRTMLWLALLVATPALAQQSVSTISDDVQTQAGQTYGALASVSGNIHVAAKAHAASVHVVSGQIQIDSGASVGNVASTSGDVTVAEHATLRSLKNVSGALRIGRDVVIDGGMSTVDGSMFVDEGGRIGGDIEIISGDLGLVRTEVDGDVVFVTGDVTIGVGSHVKGRLYLKKPLYAKTDRPPRVVIGPGAVVDGPLVFELPVTLYVHSTAKTGPISGATPIAFSTPSSPKN